MRMTPRHTAALLLAAALGRLLAKHALNVVGR